MEPNRRNKFERRHWRWGVAILSCAAIIMLPLDDFGLVESPGGCYPEDVFTKNSANLLGVAILMTDQSALLFGRGPEGRPEAMFGRMAEVTEFGGGLWRAAAVLPAWEPGGDVSAMRWHQATTVVWRSEESARCSRQST